ncbi:MAG TPA: hypothetical protein VFZ66_22800 [Herpetosiphonaceae bacterium]
MADEIYCQITNQFGEAIVIVAQSSTISTTETLASTKHTTYKLDPAYLDLQINYTELSDPSANIILYGTKVPDSSPISIKKGVCLCIIDGTSVHLVPSESLLLTVGQGNAFSTAQEGIHGVKCGEGEGEPEP